MELLLRLIMNLEAAQLDEGNSAASIRNQSNL
jgi:hypothetical protein